MSRKKFSNGGGQEKCDGTKFAAKFGCDAAAAAVAEHGRHRRQKSFNKKEVKMNKIYRTVYNETTNTWTAVAEIAKAKGKSKSSKTAVASVAVAGALLSSTAVQAEGLKWGDGATAEGYESIAMGVNSTAKSKYTITLGARAKNETNGEAAVIIGNDAKAIADVNASTAANTMGQQVAIGEASVANSQSVALGAQTYATGQASIAIGGDDLGNNDSKTSAGKYTGTDAWRNYAGQPITVEGVTTKDASDPAIGFTSTTASGRGSIALGHMGQSTGKASVAIGADSHAEADGAIAAGMVSQATGAAAVAVGVGAQAKKDHATAIGLKAVASETNSFAAGTNAQASKTGATAVGVDSNALAEHSIAIGSNAKVSQTAPTTTQNTKGVSDASIAIGQTSYAEGLAAVAVGAKTKAIEHAVAIGTETKAEGLSAVAIGSNSQATTTNSVAVGTTSKASGANATALGQATQALGQSSVAVGDGAVSTAAGWGTAVGNSSSAAYGAAAYGHLANAAGDFGTALGDNTAASGSNSVAVGKDAKAKAESVIAIGKSAGQTSDATSQNTNTRAIMIGSSSGSGAQNINDSVLMGLNAGKNLGATTKIGSHNIGLGASALADANGSTNVALATQAGMGATGNNNFFGQVNAGSYVTGDNNVAIGKNALKGTDAAKLTVSDAVALGTDATANKDKAVALGAGASTATEAKQISTATVGSTTYGGFAGKVNATGYQVSVGAKDAERQLKHVAPGEISSTSTDAINGSQLYSVASGLQTQIANISSSGGNVHFYHVNGASTDNNYNNDGATGAKAMAAGINAKAKGASSIAIGNATVEKESTANGAGTAKTESEGAIAIGDTSYAAGTHAIAMGQARAEQKDSIAVGSNARSTAEYTVAIGQNAVSSKQNAISIGSSSNTAADNSIAIGSDSSTSSNGSVALGHGSQATRDAINATAVKATSTAAVAQNQVYALDAASNTDKNNIAATVKGTSGAVSVGTQQDTRQIINVAAGTEDSDAVNVAQLKSVANLVKNTTPTKVAPATGSKITVNNKGTATAPDYELDLSADTKTSLNKADTAMQNFKVATVSSKGGTQTAGENVGNGETLTFEAGDNVSISQTGKKITINATGSGVSKVEAATNSPITVGGTGTATDPYKVGVSTVALTHTARGVVNTPAATDAGKLVTAGEIAKAINNSGFIATSGKSGTGQVSGTSEELVNPGDIVKFTAGNGIKIEQNKGEFTISNITGGASGTPSVVEAATNNPITVGGTGTAADPYKVGVSTVALTNSATGTVNAPNATDSGKLVTAGEVAKAINGSGFTLKTSAVSGEGEKDAASTTDEIVNPGDAVEMIAGKNLKVKQSADGKVTYSTKDAVQFNTVTVGGVSIDQNNGINAGSKKITNVAAGSVSATSRDAVNGSQLYAVANNPLTFAGDSGTNVERKLGSTVNVKGGVTDAAKLSDNNIGVVANGTDGLNVKLAKELKGLTSAEFKDAAGNTTAIGGNGVTITPKAAGKKPVSLTSNGLNNGGNTVTGVGSALNLYPAGTPKTAGLLDLSNLSADQKASAATAGDLANMGWVVSSDKTTGNESQAFSGQVKNAGEVEFVGTGAANVSAKTVNGKHTVTVGVDSASIADSIAQPVVYTKADGSKAYKRGNKFYDAQTGGNEIQPADVIASMNNAAGSTTAPMTLANVKDNLKDAANGKAVSTPAGGSRADLTKGKGGSNAATVNDVLNAGFTVQGNGVAKDFVTHGDTVNFANGQGTVAKVESKDGVTKVSFDTPMQYVDNTGRASTDPTNTVSLVGKDSGKPVQVKNVAAGTLSNTSTDAVNGSQLYAVANNPLTFAGDSGTNVERKLGSTVNVKGGVTDAAKLSDNNIGVVANGTDGLNVKLAKELKGLTSAEFKDAAGNTTAIGGNGVTITPKAAGKKPVSLTSNGLNNGGNRITNVAPGTADTDAVNVSQLNQAAAKAANKVEAGSNIVVTPTQNKDGSTTYKVATANDLKANSFTAGGVSLSAKGINAGNKAITNVAAGVNNTDAANVGQVKAAKTEVKAGTNIASVVETKGSNGQSIYTVNADGASVSAGSTALTVTKGRKNANNVTDYAVDLSAKTKADIAKGAAAKDALDTKGLTFTGDTGTTGVKKLGSQVAVTGDSNITTKADASGVNVALKRDLNVDSVTAGNTTVNNGGVTIKSPTTGNPNNTVNLTANGLSNGGKQITNVASGLNGRTVAQIKAEGSKAAEWNNAATVGDLTQVENNVTNISNNYSKTLGGDNNQYVDNTGKLTPAGKVALKTYNVSGQKEYVNNSVISAIKNMNEQGIKFFHVNDGQTQIDQATNTEDSSASGRYAVAIGYQAKGNGVDAVAMGSQSVASGQNGIAIGKGAQATGKNSISIGTGNKVSGANSGAFGDPTIMDGVNSYSVGNNNTVATDNTFVLGNNVTATKANSAFLGNKSGSFSQTGSTTDATTGVHKAVSGSSNYTYLGANDANVAGVSDTVGIVSVGNASETRQVQGVAAGVISATSTDAINGSQLYYTNQAINQNINNQVVNMGNQLNQKIDDVAADSKAGTAAAMAVAGLPQAYLPGKSMMAVGGSVYRGASGYAIGYSSISDGGNWIIKGTVTGNSRGHVGGTAAVGYQW